MSQGVTAPKGFYAAGVYAGIKKKRKDMALVTSEVPCTYAGAFTTNLVKAAPVKWDLSLLHNKKKISAIILNSGVANACTKEAGEEDNKEMAFFTAKALHVDVESVLTASTGVIGVRLPMDKIKDGITELSKELSQTEEAAQLAAQAIMTTDTVVKQTATTFSLGDKTVTIGAMSKGSGMIHPNMATMLAVITTDLAISQELLQEAVSADVKDSFNMISVDRDTSTNDSYVVLANGLANNQPIVSKGIEYETFCQALHQVTTTLSKMMAKDGEGAQKLLEAKVIHASEKQKAAVLAKSIITSNLVKTAMFGNDANWGRILCAMGYSGATFNPEQTDLSLISKKGVIQLVKDGEALLYSESLASDIMNCDEVTVVADLKEGCEMATAWGCDLTYDYVKINADYRS